MEIDILNAILLYLCILMGGAGMLFFLHWLGDWRQPWKLSEESLLQCPDCHFAFIVRRRSQNGRCPRCDRLCQVRRKN